MPRRCPPEQFEFHQLKRSTVALRENIAFGCSFACCGDSSFCKCLIWMMSRLVKIDTQGPLYGSGVPIFAGLDMVGIHVFAIETSVKIGTRRLFCGPGVSIFAGFDIMQAIGCRLAKHSRRDNHGSTSNGSPARRLYPKCMSVRKFQQNFKYSFLGHDTIPTKKKLTQKK